MSYTTEEKGLRGLMQSNWGKVRMELFPDKMGMAQVVVLVEPRKITVCSTQGMVEPEKDFVFESTGGLTDASIPAANKIAELKRLLGA